MRTQVKHFVIIAFSFMLMTRGYSQQIEQAPYTLTQVNNEITNLDNKISSLITRKAMLQQQQVSNPAIDNSAAITNANESIQKLEAERQKWVDIKTSIEFVQNNNLTVNESKDGTQNVPQSVTVIKQADFDLLPEQKKQHILSHPELYILEP